MTGDGTAENPYTVASVSDFRELGGKSGYVIMTADVDFNSAGSKVNFSPISIKGSLYFDGKGHKIENFYQKTSAEGGLFGSFSGTFENCEILNAYILSTGVGTETVYFNVGIISDYICSGSVFSNVTVTGMINAVGKNCYTGGFGGTSDGNASFTDCKSVVNIQANGYAGGFWGRSVYNSGSEYKKIFTRCISACRIYNGAFAGGYVGQEYSGGKFEYMDCISQCYFQGAKYQCGFGYGDMGTYINCASICTMVGASEYACGISQSNQNCVQSYSKCTFDGCKRVYGIGDGNKNQCYAACTTQNSPEGAVKYGIGDSRSSNNYLTYYDSDIFDDNMGGSEGATTEQLKSADWLREQGWAI